jgi:hypothetical protein
MKAVENAQQLAHEVAKQTESLILEQLNDFISRGLICVEQVGPTFVQVVNPLNSRNTVSIQQSVRLVLKDKEYVEKLEKENKELRDILAKLRSAM